MDPTLRNTPTISRTSSQEERANDERRAQQRRQSNARTLFGSVVVVAILYVARQVFIPVALAVLFAFLLRPVVGVLERSFLRRRASVILVIATTVALLGLGGWALFGQANAMALEISKYSGNLEQKFRVFRHGSIHSLSVVEKTLQKISDNATERTERPDMKVRIIPDRNNIAERYKTLAPSIEFIASAFLVIVLVFFLLDEQEKMRDRLLRVAGRAHLTVTTQAIGETAYRISRYLFTQAIMNLGFGLVIGVGLALLGIPHAPLWGVLAFLLRFVPYIGTFLAGALPTLLALAVFPGWWGGVKVLLLFVVTDQILAGFVEPAVIGHRVGVSPVALLVSAIFWGWLWGPVGLLLSTPITVCATVAGEFIPALRIFSILFGTEAPLEDYLSFYNRLLLRDRSRAWAIADRFAEENDMEETFEQLFIPTLTFAAEELERKRISRAHDHFIKDTIRELIIRLGDHNAHVDPSLSRVVAVSVAGERLSLGTLMLTQTLRADGRAVDYFTDLTDEEVIAYIAEEHPAAVLISCSNPNHLDAGYKLLSLVRGRFVDLPILAGGSAFLETHDAALKAGASFVATSLGEARDALDRLLKRARRATA